MKKSGLSVWKIFFLFAGFSGLLTAMNQSQTFFSNKDANIFMAQNKILASTVQLALINQDELDSGSTYEDIAVGLGTLVQYGEHQFIMTHNHWPSIGDDLDRVELRDAAGELLMELEGAAFSSLVRYQDAGTLIIQAPFLLAGLVSAPLGGDIELQKGDLLLLATRDKDLGRGLKVARAQIEWVEPAGLPREILLQGNKGAVSRGDSGGGVWYKGKLVGNLNAIFEEIENSPWPWSTSGLEHSPTGAILVAGQPLNGTSTITAEDLVGTQDLAYVFDERSDRQLKKKIDLP